MTETLTLTARTEAVEFDRDVLSTLCDEHGVGIESYLTGQLMAVGEEIDLAATQLREGELRGLDRTCARIRSIAGSIGMRTVVTAAEAVRAAIGRGDDTALAACATRMIRLGHPAGMDNWTVRHGTVA